jgi:sulfite exporter TauE/SafE
MEIFWLIFGTFSVAVIHTLLGPDHYLPFIALSKARKWSLNKTMLWTFLCGLGHVLSSIILAVFIVLIGSEIFKLNLIEGIRSEIVSWLLILFGAGYLLYGLIFFLKNKKHKHYGINHEHSTPKKEKHKNMTFWVLFLIFILGPCEPLIPLVLYPALKGEWLSLILVSIVFSIATIFTMEGLIVFSHYSLNKLKFLDKYERFSHLTAGAIILFCGLAIKILGW